MPVVDVNVNCPDSGSAAAIAEPLLTERLVAASNITSPVASRYWWQGEIEDATEATLVLKTRSELSEAVIDRVQSMHPYVTAAIWVMTPTVVSADYERWVYESTTSG